MQVLEEEKVHQMMSIGEYPLYLVPMDDDLLSFELDLSYKVWDVYIYFLRLKSTLVGFLGPELSCTYISVD